jgi:hypothetical protein
MNSVVNQWGPVAVIVAGYLLGIYFQNRRIDDLRDSMNRRFDDLRDVVNKRFDGSLDLLKSEVKRIEERLDRLEHPVIRQSSTPALEH